MAAERFTPRDDTDGQRDDEFRGGRRDWRRWWDKAEALDPERWKAMASAWSSLWQDEAKEAPAEQAVGHGDQDLSLLRRGDQASGDQVQTLRHLAGPVPEPARYNFISGQGEMDPALRKGYAPPRLTRSTADAMAAGVLSGLGHFFGVDPTWLRIAFALATIFTAIIPGIAFMRYWLSSSPAMIPPMAWAWNNAPASKPRPDPVLQAEQAVDFDIAVRIA